MNSIIQSTCLAFLLLLVCMAVQDSVVRPDGDPVGWYASAEHSEEQAGTGDSTEMEDDDATLDHHFGEAVSNAFYSETTPSTFHYSAQDQGVVSPPPEA